MNGQQKRKMSKSRLMRNMHAFTDSAGNGIWVWDILSGKLVCNPSFSKILGLGAIEREMTMRKFDAHIHREDREQWEKHKRICIHPENESCETEVRLIKTSGAVIWTRHHCRITERDGKKQPRICTALLQDISGTKGKTEKRWAEIEHQNHVANLAGLGSWEWDVVRDYITFNEDYRELLGYEPEEISGPFSSLRRIMYEAELADLKEALEQYIKGEEKFFSREIRGIHKNGQDVWLQDIVTVVERDPKGRPTCLRGSVLNITQRVQSEQKLRRLLTEIEQSNRALQMEVREVSDDLHSAQKMSAAMFSANPQINILFSRKFEILDCNPRAVEYFGFTTKKAFLRNFIPFIKKSMCGLPCSEKLTNLFPVNLRKLLKQGSEQFTAELEIDGRPRSLDILLKRIPYAGSFAVVAYINERSENDERIQLMMDATPLAATLTDENLNVIDCNRAAIRLSGCKSKREYLLRHKSFYPEFQPDGADSKKKMKDGMIEAFQKGFASFIFIYRLPDGEFMPAEITLKRVKWRDTFRLVGFAQDLRKIRKAEADLIQKDRLMQAVNNTATGLISSSPQNFDRAILRALETIGTAADADQAYIWENYGLQDKMHSRRLYLWTAGKAGKPKTENKPTLSYSRLPYFWETLCENRPVNEVTKNLPDRERSYMERLGVSSTLIIPLFHEDKLWGFIGFNNFRKKTKYTKTEEQVLQSGGILIISSILHNRATQDLLNTAEALRKHGKLLETVNEVAALMLNSEKNDFTRRVQQSLQKLGQCTGADRVSLWRCIPEDGKLLCSRLPGWRDGHSFEEDKDQWKISLGDYLPQWNSEGKQEDLHLYKEKMDEPLRSMPILSRTNSLLISPVYIQRVFWGFIGFSHKRKSHRFSETERQLLCSAGMMIASGIMRNEINERLLEAKESALESVRAKNDFLSRMSHEIRTPINAIIGMSAIAGKNREPEKLADCLEKIDNSS